MKIPTPRLLPSGNWFIWLRLGGENIPITTATRRECINQAQIIKAEYLAGREVRRKKLPPASDMTLRELLDSYIDKFRPVLSPSTVRGYCTIRDHRFQAVVDKKLRAISDWQQVINAEATACSAKTLKNAWSLVRSAMVKAKLPAPEVTLPQIVQNERPFLTADEIRRFVAAIHGSRFEIPILLGLHGLRRSEIAALDWAQIDLNAGVIHVEGAVVPDESGKYVRKQTNKGEASRRAVPIMIPELRTALEAVSKSDRTGPVVHCHINSIYKAVNTICEREGLPLIGAHGLRHSMASLGHFVGVPEKEMQLIGGWKDPATMRKIYTHVENAGLLRAQNAMAAFYSKTDLNENANENENKNA